MAVVLLVDDEPRSLDAMEMALEDCCDLRRASSGAEALAIIDREPVDVILSDQRMAGMTGVELLTAVRASHPAIGRMIVTGYTEPQDMIAAINDAGIERFIQKPWHPDALVAAVTAMATAAADHQPLAAPGSDPFAAVIRSPGGAMDGIVAKARVLAAFDVPCLLVGETGSGRHALACAMAAASGRMPLRSVSALSPEAPRAVASGGDTVFLRDLDRAPAAAQAAILDALTTAEAGPRLIAAIPPGGEEALLPELRYRLSVQPLHLPPLRDRPDDIELLCSHFLRAMAQEEGGLPLQPTAAALHALRAYRWPGNVRELRNAMQRAHVMAEGLFITDEWLPTNRPENLAAEQGDTYVGASRGGESLEGGFLPGTSLADAEQQLILRTLQHFDNHKERTAAALGISLKTLYNKLKGYEASQALPEK